MVNVSYANAYKEVLVIINNLVKEDYEKIPIEYINFLETNANQDYDFSYDNSKAFSEQELLDDTKYILFGLFEKFGATEVQKSKIQSFKKNYYNKLEEEQREKYNPDDIFKNKKEVRNEEQIEEKSLTVVQEKKWYQKIFNIIKNLFNRKK